MSANPEKYQLLPELDPESFAALKADIAARGVIVPVLVDEFGAIIDGHNRARACRELGINDYPVEVRSGLSEADKRTLARKLNVLRRHLSREQVRQLIGDQLRDTPEWADRRIGRELGVDHKTVGAVRADLGSTGEIPQLEKTLGGDDKARPAKQSRRSRKQATHDEWTDKDDDDWDDDNRPHRRRVNAWNDPAKQAKLQHAVDLIKLGVDPNSEQVNKLIRESAACVIERAGYRIFAHCTPAGERDWHLFILFLAREWTGIPRVPPVTSNIYRKNNSWTPMSGLARKAGPSGVTASAALRTSAKSSSKHGRALSKQTAVARRQKLSQRRKRSTKSADLAKWGTVS
jgi:ParB-like chromosome segregation protein Spo0J